MGGETIDPQEALRRDVDPVAQPAEYQQLLLGLVGDRDPALVQVGQPDDLAELIAEAGPDLRTRPVPGQWSVLECAGHLLDAEVVYSGRYRWTLAHDEPPMIGYDQNRWVERLHHQDDDPDELLALFRALRRANLELWRRTPEVERLRAGVHAERGPESYGLSFGLIAGHGILHLAQARRTLETVSSGYRPPG